MKPLLRIGLALFILVHGHAAFSKEWVDSKNPFLDATPTPIWKPGGYIEIIYELNLKDKVDSIENSNWTRIDQLYIERLELVLTIGKSSYSCSKGGVGSNSGKFTFKIYGPDFEEAPTLTATNWNSITYSLLFKSALGKEATPNTPYNNPRVTDKSGRRLEINRFEYDASKKLFSVSVYSSHSGLNIQQAQILVGPESTKLGTCTKVKSFSDQKLPGHPDMKCAYELEFSANQDLASSIPILSASNSEQLYLDMHFKLIDEENFLEFSGFRPMSYAQALKISGDIKGNATTGGNKGVVEVTTTLPATDMKLVFDDSPYDLPVSTKLELPGKPKGEAPHNSFAFEIPSDKVDFRYSTYKIHFEGKSENLGRSIEKNEYRFTKAVARFSRTIPSGTANGELEVIIKLLEASPGSIKLEYGTTAQTIEMAKQADGLTYTVKLPNVIVRSNLNKEDSQNVFKYRFNVFGDQSEETQVVVQCIDSLKIRSKIAELKGSEKAKKDDLKKYLSSESFVGNLDEIATRLLDEAAKPKNKQKWKETWTAIGKIAINAAPMIIPLLL